MLKVCWDCIAGNSREQSENELVYNKRLNGDTRAPPWPHPENTEIMFVLPRKLNAGDKIIITGVMRNSPAMLTVNLITGYNEPDYRNIACRFEADFANDKISAKVVQNGNEEMIEGDDGDMLVSNYFTDLNFSFNLSLRLVNSNYEDIPIIDIYVESSLIMEVPLKHNLSDIRFLMLNGDIEKVQHLSFQFS